MRMPTYAYMYYMYHACVHTHLGVQYPPPFVQVGQNCDLHVGVVAMDKDWNVVLDASIAF